MRCPKCNNRLAIHDVWCMNCGNQTAILKNELSALNSLKNSWIQVRANISANVPAAGFAIILGVIPIGVIIWLYMTVISNDYQSDIEMIISLMIKTAVVSLFIPMLLLAFKPVVNASEYRLCLKDLLKALTAYPKYLLYSLVSGLFFVLFYIICFGLPSFGSDPILRLVWIVLINYWTAIILPAPVLMEKTGVSPMSAIKLSYKHLHDLRWNIYLMALVLSILNAVAFSLLIFPLLFTIPLSWFAIRDYTLKLLEFELLSYRL